jgi:Virulence factor BrkB
MQSTLNAIWKADPKGGTVSRLLRARAASLGLVAALGFLLLVSLVISAGLSALSEYVNAHLPFGHLILQAINFLISFALNSVLFAAIYKVLPDKDLRAGWLRRDRLPVQYRQVPDRALHRKQRGFLQLWGGGRSDCSAAMDLLLDADFPALGRVH